jgi:hypothetical protein
MPTASGLAAFAGDDGATAGACEGLVWLTAGCCPGAVAIKAHEISIPMGSLRNMKGCSSGIVTPEAACRLTEIVS